MSKNCIECVKNERTGLDLLCDGCRQIGALTAQVNDLVRENNALREKYNAKYWEGIAEDNRKLATQIKQLQDEKNRRVYYQDIVYHVCGVLDRLTGKDAALGNGIVCGTVDSPSIEVQDVLGRLAEKMLIYIPRNALEAR